MSMRTKSAPRRIYVRASKSLVCFGGLYFGPSEKNGSELDVATEVTIETLAPVGGRKRIKVTQVIGDKRSSENWVEKHLNFATRKAATESDAEQEAAQ
jgi:hypothetical protein